MCELQLNICKLWNITVREILIHLNLQGNVEIICHMSCPFIILCTVKPTVCATSDQWTPPRSGHFWLHRSVFNTKRPLAGRHLLNTDVDRIFRDKCSQFTHHKLSLHQIFVYFFSIDQNMLQTLILCLLCILQHMAKTVLENLISFKTLTFFHLFSNHI